MVFQLPTCLNNIDSDIFDTCINLLPNELGRRFVNSVNALGILSRKSCRCSHCIASMHRNDFLVSFQPAD